MRFTIIHNNNNNNSHVLGVYDISGGISSNIQLFAEDCILYCIIKEKHDQDVLQADINQLIK